jgi:hypothetical protein
MNAFLDELVKVAVAERGRAAHRFALARAARIPRLPLRVRIGLRLVALGEHLCGVRRASAAASVRSRSTDR